MNSIPRENTEAGGQHVGRSYRPTPINMSTLEENSNPLRNPKKASLCSKFDSGKFVLGHTFLARTPAADNFLACMAAVRHNHGLRERKCQQRTLKPDTWNSRRLSNLITSPDVSICRRDQNLGRSPLATLATSSGATFPYKNVRFRQLQYT